MTPRRRLGAGFGVMLRARWRTLKRKGVPNRWSAPWNRRALLVVAGRFARHARGPYLRLAPRPHLLN